MPTISIRLKFSDRIDPFVIRCGVRGEPPVVSLRSLTEHLTLSCQHQHDKLRGDSSYHLVYLEGPADGPENNTAYLPLSEVQRYLNRPHRLRDRAGRSKLIDYRSELVSGITRFLDEWYAGRDRLANELMELASSGPSFEPISEEAEDILKNLPDPREILRTVPRPREAPQ